MSKAGSQRLAIGKEYDVPFQGDRSVDGAARPDAPSIGAGAAGLLGAAMGAVALIVGLAVAITQRRRRSALPFA